MYKNDLEGYHGDIIFTSGRHLFFRHDSLEAELSAIMDILVLELQWSQYPIIIESNCLEAFNLLNKKDRNKSCDEFLIHEIKQIIEQQLSYYSCLIYSKPCNPFNGKVW